VSISGIASLIYGVEDVSASARFFQDFGLTLDAQSKGRASFTLPEGSSVEMLHYEDPALRETWMVGHGVREVIWGVDTQEALDQLADSLGKDCKVDTDKDGTVHFLPDFGIPMGLRLFQKKSVVTAPDPINSPGRINRLNQHRKWRRRAYPKGISHAVYSIPNYLEGYAFMHKRLGFRLSDDQCGFGCYLRADGSYNHHSFLLLNAHAPLDGNDGNIRFHHANFAVEDIDELMIGANHMVRQGWEKSHLGLGRHRIDSALFYYLPCPAGGEAEYGADSDYIDDAWVPREWTNPLFAYAQFVHDLPPFLMDDPAWDMRYLTPEEVEARALPSAP
jgi:catechol 2,3-dioxygenase-like lactoylglutathione lyase family enzyme